MAESNIDTRKKLRTYILDGKVTVNGIVCMEPTYEVKEDSDIILYQGNVVTHQGKKYYMFHKPTGCITARQDEEHQTVMEYFPEEIKRGIFPVGRLDKDTEGLLLFTNDGEFDYQLMNPIHHVEKTYFFWALGELTEKKIEQFEAGFLLENEVYVKPARLTMLKSGIYEQFEDEIKLTRNAAFQTEHKRVVCGTISLTEGKKHQVKRMLKQMGCYVIYLKRISIGNLSLDETLKPGEYRELTEVEKRLVLQ